MRPIRASILLSGVAALGVHAADGQPVLPLPGLGAPTDTGAAMTLEQKASYLIGRNMGQAVKQYALEKDLVILAISDELAGKPSPISEADGQAILGEYQGKLQEKQARQGDERKASNKTWLEANGKKPNVKTTASGLQYEVLSTGSGKTPSASDTVSVNYRGTLLDGTEFDASEKHGGPASFPVGGVIKGWTEALQLMKEGDKWRLSVPAELAYGDQAPPNIGPNQVLIFDVELLKVMPATPQPK